ncbi:hypothetical protein LTR36_002858 [Oleoguttula mirabilis]|uniref:Uncharacterized protein n=1 Tax=Oleoguttula mirabilis TaxID=1507867 RepID=A0AAV9JKM2_9PEZI|nr:hypothetical protein LTR36_002858 [Oleoguttula mirabilis]
MSSQGKPASSSPNSGPPAAIDVSFARIADQSGESSSSKRSNGSARHSQELEAAGEQKQERRGHRARHSGGFLLDTAFANGQPPGAVAADRHGKRKAQDGRLHVDKRRLGGPRLSVESSHASSPLSREVSADQANAERDWTQPSSRPVSMDPAQLVQMALNLSESRRRHVSGPLQLQSPSSPRDIRRISGAATRYGTVRSRSSGGRRASYTNDGPSQPSPSPRRSGTAEAEERERASDVPDVGVLEVPSDFTPATLSRAEKARNYFELASEHRRLLQHLPPLKTDANAPGNHTFISTSSPHSAHPEITRVPSYLDNKHELGRKYNPLQALRNRRLRARERRPLTAPPEAWQDIEKVALWIGDVEAATDHLQYRSVPDRVRLPSFAGEREDVADSRASSKNHRRTDTASSITTRPENGWSIEPCELLADTYWTEKDDNKSSIENRNGNPIFPARTRFSLEQPRHSADTTRTAMEDDKAGNGADNLSFTKKANRRSLLLPKRHKRLTRSRSPSMTSVSSDEGRTPPVVAYGSEDGEENIGPLERHMQQMIAKDEKGELSSPDLVSPDHWESSHTQFPVLRADHGRSRRDTLSQGNGRLSVDTARAPHKRAKSADGRVGVGNRALLSKEDLSAADSGSPKFLPSIGMDLISPSAEWPSPKEQKSRLHKLPFIRSHSKDRNNIERTDFANTSDNKPSSNGVSDPRSSQDSARPSFVQRHRTTESLSSSLRRQTTNTGSNGSIKEPGSTIGRFFKGGRIGDIVRNESSSLGDRFRNRERSDEAAGSGLPVPDGNEIEDVDPRDNTRPVIVVDDDSDNDHGDDTERDKAKPRYNLQNLPSFISPRGRGRAEMPMTTSSDPIAQQQRAQREAGRSPRFDRLAPPRINLPTDDDASSPDLVADSLLNDKRKSYGFLETGPQPSSRASLVSFDSSGDGVGVARDSRLSKLKSGGQRHWSISDRLQPEQASTKVAMRDVARVRALLLSSGIKAREIQRRANTPRDDPLPVMKKVAEFVGQNFGAVPRMQEHLVASRALSDKLSSTLSDYEGTLERFQSVSARSLAAELDDLQRKAVDQLTKLVHETSDDADAFVVELTTKQPQDIKRVDDAIDDMLRERRRQFRLLRRAGFKLLEWLVLGIMWWVWFLVVLFNTARRVVVGIARFLRWLFWF